MDNSAIGALLFFIILVGLMIGGAGFFMSMVPGGKWLYKLFLKFVVFASIRWVWRRTWKYGAMFLRWGYRHTDRGVRKAWVRLTS